MTHKCLSDWAMQDSNLRSLPCKGTCPVSLNTNVILTYVKLVCGRLAGQYAPHAPCGAVAKAVCGRLEVTR